MSDCHDHVLIVYHGLTQDDDVILPVTSESVFISPSSTVTVKLATCFSLEVKETSDLAISIRYESTGKDGLVYSSNSNPWQCYQVRKEISG